MLDVGCLIETFNDFRDPTLRAMKNSTLPPPNMFDF